LAETAEKATPFDALRLLRAGGFILDTGTMRKMRFFNENSLLVIDGQGFGGGTRVYKYMRMYLYTAPTV
jgi:hypothetical protein